MRAAEGKRGELPFLGTKSDKIEATVGGVIAASVTVVYVFVARSFDTSTSLVEGVSLWASLACVWLARTENVLTMLYGLVAVVLLGFFLLDIELVGQGWLQFIFYVPVQLVGWWAWCRGGSERTELPVTRLTVSQWLTVLVLAAVIWTSCWWVFSRIYDDPAYLPWDSSIVASSVIAQSLMSWKKRESWLWWTLPVNVSSLGLFIKTESWAFVFLYSVFLVNSLLGLRDWFRSEKIHR